jgi:hypothetical protein
LDGTLNGSALQQRATNPSLGGRQWEQDMPERTSTRNIESLAKNLPGVAPPGRLCEAQTLTYREKISNLMHFHARFLSDADGCYFD